MRILIAWLGNTDLRASDGDVGAADGPILSGLKGKPFDRAVLLSNYPEKVAAKYVGWVQTHTSVHIQIEGVKLRGPTDFEDIYRAASNVAGRNEIESAAGVAYVPPQPRHTRDGGRMDPTLQDALSSGTCRILSRARRTHGVFSVRASRRVHPIQQCGGRSRTRAPCGGSASESPGFEHIIHRSGVMKRLVARAKRLAAREVPVLIQGESPVLAKSYLRGRYINQVTGLPSLSSQ